LNDQYQMADADHWSGIVGNGTMHPAVERSHPRCGNPSHSRWIQAHGDKVAPNLKENIP